MSYTIEPIHTSDGLPEHGQSVMYWFPSTQLPPGYWRFGVFWRDDGFPPGYFKGGGCAWYVKDGSTWWALEPPSPTEERV